MLTSWIQMFRRAGKVDVPKDRSGPSKLEILVDELRSELNSKDKEIEKLRRQVKEVTRESDKRLSYFDRATSGDYKDDGNRKPTAKQREMRLMLAEGQISMSKIEPPKFLQALVFDCGTSETKTLLYTYDETRECQISLIEIRLDGETKNFKRKGVIEHIENGTCKEGVLDDFSNLYLKACEIVCGNDNEKKIDFCIVGASAWARKLYKNGDLTRDKNKLMYDLRDNGFFPKIFPQRDESHYELLATVYAFAVAQRTKMIPRHLMFGGVLASGGGSTQYTFVNSKASATKHENVFQSLNVEVGNREGVRLFTRAAENDLDDAEAPILALESWISSTKKKIEVAIAQSKSFRRVSGFVLCISAQYFAALEISKTLEGCEDKYGAIANKASTAHTISASRAAEAANAYVVQQKKRWREMTSGERASLAKSTDKRNCLKSFALGLANVQYCGLLWSRYFEGHTSLCFKRDWKIGHAGTFFRTTWSAGWFMNILKYHGHVDLAVVNPQMNDVLALLQRSRELQKKRTVEFRLAHSKVAYFVNDMVASHIGNVPNLVEYHTHIASVKGDEVLGWLKELEAKMDSAHLEGLEHRMKSYVSMERKLHSVIAGLLIEHAENVGDGSYAPLESEIVRGVQDGLRFTFVCDPSTYYRNVRIAERYLKDKGCKFYGKNYWQNPDDPHDRRTMYMGLNMVVLLPPDPHAHHFSECRYPFELQFHTPDSFKLKSGDSHKIYERIRTESVPARRTQLIKECFGMWETVTVPTDTSLEPPCIAMYRGMDGEFESKRKVYNTRKRRNPIVDKFLEKLKNRSGKLD